VVRKEEIKIGIVEDNNTDRDLLNGLLTQSFNRAAIPLDVRCFPNGEDFLLEGPTDLDMVFLDIQMGEQSGIDVARKIRETNERVVLVFVTNNPQYSLEGYAVEALDYLIKPVTPEILERVLKKALQRLQNTDRTCMTIRNHDGFFIVNYSDIYYIEFTNRKLEVQTKTGRISCLGTMQAMEETLPDSFFRCHSGFLVNLLAVERLNGQDAVVGGRLIPISKHRRKEFIHSLTKYIGEKL
jgi:DNA-binding LytR/AlgR family response regulator